ncbi:968_t:CDS:2 [Funneliformis geosporum]|uniref:alanine--glyoxylate transaminase n=1 Tax=Funneliformis geosporum TaxID=1117311 RepID=A0A9W4SCM0_9GLOM|nr:968_t:CDS:2 [Funneliformis geosporum]CAI2163725.1 17107_t:CDS:2 [Funneliformis geosporum]
MSSQQNHKLCMIPGPVEFHEDVLTSMSTKATSHVSPSFIPVFGESIELLRKVFVTEHGQPIVVSGSGTLGWDMVASNLVEPGEEALVLNSGYFGDSFAACLKVYGAKVTEVKSEIGDRPTLQEISDALSTKFKLITITHVDTSTGVLSDVKAIAELVKKKSPNTLIVVDGVCSVGSEEIRVDEWNLDVVLTASQKAIGVPPGLSILIASERAIQTFKDRKTPVPSYYASWAHWLPIMHAYESRKGMYFATPPVQLIYALNTSLKQITSTPLETRFEQHKKVSDQVKNVVESLGLQFVPKSREVAANGMTAVYYPEGIQPADLLQKVASHNVVIAGGLHRAIASKYFRIGHMGISVTEPERKHIDNTIAALTTSLKDLGYSGK